MSREFKIVVWGATGVTGGYSAEYLAKLKLSNFSWAIAGRNLKKLQTVKQELVKINPANEEIVKILVHENNFESLSELVKKTEVIISTVGPFAKHGETLVKACVEHGTHYIDSTGESNFIKTIIDKYHKTAKEKKVYIIPSCGFDSVPSDLGAFLIAHHFNSKYNEQTKSAYLSVKKIKGAASGGTIHSALGILELSGAERKSTMSRNCLVDGEVPPTDSESLTTTLLHYNKLLKSWQSFYFMEFPNIRYVARSNSLLKNAYGENFKYGEGFSHSWLIRGILMNLIIFFAGSLLVIPPVRSFVKWMVPQGSGPTRQEVATGHFVMSVVGESEKNKKCLLTIKGVSDPGYGETCKMVVESALCIALVNSSLPKEVATGSNFPNIEGGVVTAASALGLVLVERLRKAHMTFDLKEISN